MLIMLMILEHANSDNHDSHVDSYYDMEVDSGNDTTGAAFGNKPQWFTRGDHKLENALGFVNYGVLTHSQVSDYANCLCYISSIEPKNVKGRWLMSFGFMTRKRN